MGLKWTEDGEAKCGPFKLQSEYGGSFGYCVAFYFGDAREYIVTRKKSSTSAEFAAELWLNKQIKVMQADLTKGKKS